MVVYGNTASTQETWYTFHNEADMDEIIASHLMGGQVVTRLQLLDDQTSKQPLI
jgi:(2Fe-2S) ferredoxin